MSSKTTDRLSHRTLLSGPVGPTPLITFKSLQVSGKDFHPHFGDRMSLLLLKRVMPKQVSFRRAYTGWRHSGAYEERELGEGRAFFRWLQKHELSIAWEEDDFVCNQVFAGAGAPVHDPSDELAANLSFAIRPVRVQERNVKLYVEDKDMLGLIGLSYGKEEDFLSVISKYIACRFEWQEWKAPSPSLIDWVKNSGLRPVFSQGQVGFYMNNSLK